MAKIERARGMSTGADYSADQIFNDSQYASMVSDTLTDDNGTIVRPVRRQGAPHFRVLGRKVSITDIERNAASPAHNAAVAAITQMLRDQSRALNFYTRIFDENGNTVEQRLFAAPVGNHRVWFTENTILFDDFVRIRPDISGRDASIFAATGQRPAIIIEVIETHPPEAETLARLFQLSRMAHQVYFFSLVGKRAHLAYRYNSATAGDRVVRVRITYCLINGDLMKNGELIELKHEDPLLRAAEALPKLSCLVN